MTLPGDSPDKKSSQHSFTLRVVAIGGEVGCITLIIVLAAVFGGLWLDRLLGTKPIITFILIIASAPLALFLTFRIAIRMIGSHQSNPPPPSGGRINTTKKEDEDW
jgi:hypothetical protein